MYQDICKPENDHYAHLRVLFREERFDSILSLVEGIPPISPYFTMSRAWEIVTHARLGNRERLRELLDFDRDVMVFDTHQGVFRRNRFALEEESRRIYGAMEHIEPDSRMPYTKGRKTRDIFSQEEFDTRALLEVFTSCFAAFASHTGQADILRNRIRPYIQGWQNLVDPDGALGAHFHPGAWISLVYYPPRGRTTSVTNSSITFGCYPTEMGSGEGIVKVDVDAMFGRIIVFPAYVGHAVTCQRSPGSRVSIAADIRLAYTPNDLERYRVGLDRERAGSGRACLTE